MRPPGTSESLFPPVVAFYSANEFRVQWQRNDNAAAYILAYWRVFDRYSYSQNRMLSNDSDEIQTVHIGSVPANNPAVSALCVHMMYSIRPSSRYMLALTYQDANGRLAPWSPFGFRAGGDTGNKPVDGGFQPVSTQSFVEFFLLLLSFSINFLQFCLSSCLHFLRPLT